MQPTNVTPDYSFITNPTQPTPRKLPFGTGSTLGRVVIILVILLGIFVVFSVVKSLLNSSSNRPALTAVVQDQAELSHLATNALQQETITTTNKNFAVTTQAAMTTEQATTLRYMSKNGMKVNAKVIGLKISSTIDMQLNTAVTTSNFDNSFKLVMQQQLATYQRDLKNAYTLTKGTIGRNLLSKEYDAASLLLVQLSS